VGLDECRPTAGALHFLLFGLKQSEAARARSARGPRGLLIEKRVYRGRLSLALTTRPSFLKANSGMKAQKMTIDLPIRSVDA